MKHFYYAKQKELLELIFQFESNQISDHQQQLAENLYAEIADYYEEINLADKAMEIIELGLKYYSFSPTLHARKASILLSSKLEDQALELLDQAEAYGHSPIRTEYLRAKAHTQKCDYEKALCLLTNMKSYQTSDTVGLSDIYFLEAYVYEKQERYEGMFTAIREALHLNPAHEEAMDRLYFCLDMCGFPQESIELCSYLIDQNPYSYLAWYNLGHIYYAQFEYQKAIEAFEYAFVINENFAPAYYECADVCMQIGDHRKALKCYEELLQFSEPSGQLLFNLGECHEHLGNLEKARILFFRALRRHPKHEEVYFHLGECYAKEGIWESAAHFYKEAVARDQSREDFLSALADVYIRLGRFKEAEPLLIAATQILPELSYIWMRLARFYISFGYPQKALDVLEESEEFAYGADILYTRAASYSHMGLEQLAVKALDEGLSEDFDRHYLFFELAPMMRHNAKVQAAIRYYRYD